MAASGKSTISTTSADPYVPVHNASHHQPDMTKTKKMAYGDMKGLFCSVLWPDELRQHELSMELELVKKKSMSTDKNRTFRKSFGHNCQAQNPKVTELKNTLENFDHRNFKPLLFSTREERKQKTMENYNHRISNLSSNSTKEERQHSGKL